MRPEVTRYDPIIDPCHCVGDASIGDLLKLLQGEQDEPKGPPTPVCSTTAKVTTTVVTQGAGSQGKVVGGEKKKESVCSMAQKRLKSSCFVPHLCSFAEVDIHSVVHQPVQPVPEASTSRQSPGKNKLQTEAT